jgi:putative FmdB family regulatory protein
MPIYAYRCESCGHAKDVIQKFSDAPLTVCPACGADAFRKQLTAPAFQLKGSGWYVTDFRDGGKKPAAASTDNTDKADKADKTGGGATPKSEPSAEPSTKSAEPSASTASASSSTPAKAQPES